MTYVVTQLNAFKSRQVYVFHISCPKGMPAPRTLPMPSLQILIDALFAEHVPTLGDDDILLPRMTNVALEQSPQGIDFVFEFLHCFTSVGILHHSVHLGRQQLQNNMQQTAKDKYGKISKATWRSQLQEQPMQHPVPPTTPHGTGIDATTTFAAGTDACSPASA